MKPIIQTKFDTESTHGNCIRACLASILEVDIDSIVEFENDMDFNIANEIDISKIEGDEWLFDLIEYLYIKGYNFSGIGSIDELSNFNGVDGYVIVFGTTERNNKHGHACIYKNNDLCHDPHPDAKGLTNILGFFKLEKIK